MPVGEIKYGVVADGDAIFIVIVLSLYDGGDGVTRVVRPPIEKAKTKRGVNTQGNEE